MFMYIQKNKKSFTMHVTTSCTLKKNGLLGI